MLAVEVFVNIPTDAHVRKCGEPCPFAFYWSTAVYCTSLQHLDSDSE